MAVSAGYQTFVLDQLRRVLPAVRAKRMFGGVGLYAEELFFALIDDDVLYLKVDDETRPDFERRGLRPFQPFGEGSTAMQYYQLPEDLLEDPEALRPWAEGAVAVARRAKRTKGTGPKRR
jgi:DNA transformation protein and related proteins